MLYLSHCVALYYIVSIIYYINYMLLQLYPIFHDIILLLMLYYYMILCIEAFFIRNKKDMINIQLKILQMKKEEADRKRQEAEAELSRLQGEEVGPA